MTIAKDIIKIKQEIASYKTTQNIGSGSSRVAYSDNFTLTGSFTYGICEAFVAFIAEEPVNSVSVQVHAYADGVELTPYFNEIGSSFGNACFVSTTDCSSSVEWTVADDDDFKKDVDFSSDKVYTAAFTLYGPEYGSSRTSVYRIEGRLITPCKGKIKTWIGQSQVPYIPA